MGISKKKRATRPKKRQGRLDRARTGIEGAGKREASIRRLHWESYSQWVSDVQRKVTVGGVGPHIRIRPNVQKHLK